MMTDLNLSIDILTITTDREADGLAMSRCNRYLNDEERQRAVAISRGLFAAEAEFHAGERNIERLMAIAKRHLAEINGLQCLKLVAADSLTPAVSPLAHPAVLCAPAYVGSMRLIDDATPAIGGGLVPRGRN